MLVSTQQVQGGMRTRLRLACALVAGLIATGQVPIQAQTQTPTPKPEPTKGAQEQPDEPVAKPHGDPALDQKINQAREEIELLELHLSTRKAQLKLAEARMAESRRWRDIFQKLHHDGFASEERYLAARDDVLMHESRVAWEKAAVQEAEMRVKQAKRRLEYGEFPITSHDSRIADLEQRLGSLERSVDLLQQEVGNLRRMVRRQWKMPDNVERPVTNAPPPR